MTHSATPYILRAAMASIFASIASLMLSVAFLMVGHGMQSTIIPVRAELEMFSSTSIGIISSFFFVGFVAGSVLGPYLILRAGHIRAFAAMISLGSAAALTHLIFIDTFTWSLARGMTGFCIACNYLIIESWLNERSTNTTRGLVMSTYIIVVYAGITSGQFSTALFDAAGFHVFVISSIALSIAVVPVALTKSAQPAPIAVVHFRPMRLYQTSPSAVVSIILVGLAAGALFSLLPLYASRIAMDPKLIPFFAGALMLGGLFLQYPLGRISDKVDRRYVLIFGAVGSIVMSLALAFNSISNAFTLILFVAILGSLLQPLYAIAAAHAYDYGEEGDMVETASGILLAYGFGSILGPIISSIAMDYLGPKALFIVVALTLSIMVLFLLVRLTQRDTLSDEDKSDYDLASTAPVGGITAPDLYEAEDDYVLVPEEYEMTETNEVNATKEMPYSDNKTNEGAD